MKSLVQRMVGNTPKLKRRERVLAFLVVDIETDASRLVVDKSVAEQTTYLQVADLLRDGIWLCERAREAFFRRC